MKCLWTPEQPSIGPVDPVSLDTMQLPIRPNWSDPGRTYRMAERTDRTRVYESVLREGTADDVLTYVNGTLLVALWPELVLPPRPTCGMDPDHQPSPGSS
jgi:hypothetical protein